MPAGAQTPEPISAGTFSLTILHNNDGESKLLHNPDRGFPGIARFVTRDEGDLQEGATGAGTGVV